MNKKVRDGLTAIILLSLVVAAFLGYKRSEYEQQNKHVEIAVNLNDIENLASTSGKKLSQELALFKVPGTTTILYKEEMLSDLKKYLSVYSGQDFFVQEKKLLDKDTISKIDKHGDLNYDYTYILVQDKSVFDRVSKNLQAKATGAYFNSYDFTMDGRSMHLLVTGLSTSTLANIGLGFDEKLISYLESIDMQVLPQIRTWDNANKEGMSVVFSELKNHKNIRTILFNDKSLPGFPEMGDLSYLAQILKQNNWNVGLIEFMPQKGFTELSYANSKNVVRFFSLDSKSIDKTTPADALDKYALAASERNDKIIFARPLTFDDANFEQAYINHISDIKSRLESRSLTVAPVVDNVQFPVDKYPVEFLLLFMSLGVLAAGLILADKLGLLKLGLIVAVVIFFIDVFLIFHTTDNVLNYLALAEKGMAMLATFIFPTYGIITTFSERKRNIPQTILAFLRVSAFSFVGAMFVVGFMADLAYMVKIDQFIGVKAAHLVPITIVLVYLYLHEKDGKGPLQRIKNLLKQPLTFGYAILSITLIAAFVIYLARTGNDAADLVSGTELKFRSLLDHLLYVRPRTKEFLIGHPLMVIIYYLGYRFRYLPFVALAIIGQVSIVDTYAHIHTPLLVSLLRTINGMWVGLVIGLICIFAYEFYNKRWGRE